MDCSDCRLELTKTQKDTYKEDFLRIDRERDYGVSSAVRDGSSIPWDLRGPSGSGIDGLTRGTPRRSLTPVESRRRVRHRGLRVDLLHVRGTRRGGSVRPRRSKFPLCVRPHSMDII